MNDLNVGHDGGLALAQVYASVDAAIGRTFYASAKHPDEPHDPAHPEVPSGAVFVANVPTFANDLAGEIAILDVLITAAGDLQILVNPLTPPQQALSQASYGYLRQNAAQDLLNGLT